MRGHSLVSRSMRAFLDRDLIGAAAIPAPASSAAALRRCGFFCLSIANCAGLQVWRGQRASLHMVWSSLEADCPMQGKGQSFEVKFIRGGQADVSQSASLIIPAQTGSGDGSFRVNQRR